RAGGMPPPAPTNLRPPQGWFRRFVRELGGFARYHAPWKGPPPSTARPSGSAGGQSWLSHPNLDPWFAIFIIRVTQVPNLTRSYLTVSLALSLSLCASVADAGPRLDSIKARGAVTCGLGDNVAGFSRHDAGKNWSGFDVDLCRAIAAAVLGDSAKAQFRPVDVLPRFLQSQDIDVVLRGLTWTFGRE